MQVRIPAAIVSSNYYRPNVITGATQSNISRREGECLIPPNKRSFSGPGGVGRGLDSVYLAEICARELASAASRCPQEASRDLQWPHVDDGGGRHIQFQIKI